MARQNVGKTAYGAAACRLIEQYQPVRLFDDPLLGRLLPAAITLPLRLAWARRYAVARIEAVAEGIYGALVCRARFIDDVVNQAMDAGVAQLVILGAGFDTRAFRLPGMEHLTVFEVDFPTVQNAKRRKLRKLGPLPANVTFVPIDFQSQSLGAAFAQSVFDSRKPAIFVWEGVTQYISEEAVRSTLSFVGACAPGSVLAFTYVLKDIIERRSKIQGADRLMDTVESSGAPWMFGLEPPEVGTYLRTFRLDLRSDVAEAEYQERYLKPLNRRLVVFKGERTAVAVRA